MLICFFARKEVSNSNAVIDKFLFLCYTLVTEIQKKEYGLMTALKLKPAFKDYIWGGTRLRDDFGKDCPFDKVAESWELSCHKDGSSVISGGKYDGLTLCEYIEQNGKNVLGLNCSRFSDFPILIKLIDAKDNLSIQVHPDNEYALEAEGEYGKTEMWYVVDADEGAELIYGFKDKISKEEFKERIENNTLLEALNSVHVRKGDVFFINSGTLHAIGKGILIAEIQQNSNTTYRVYDYGRVGADGKPRELHISKALDVTDISTSMPTKASSYERLDGYSKQFLASCDYFTVFKLDIETHAQMCADNTSFNSLLILEGSGTIDCGSGDSLDFVKGDSIFVPAGLKDYTVNGKCKLILTKID